MKDATGATPKKRRVVITGIGAVTPLGNDRETTWRRVLAGESGAAPVMQFDATTWSTTFACEVRNYKRPKDAVLPDHATLLNKPSDFGTAACYEAMLDSGVHGAVDPARFGISFGCGIGAVSPKQLARMLRGIERVPGLGDLSRRVEASGETNVTIQNHPGTLAFLMSARWNAVGPVSTIHTACASSGQSVGLAFLQIQRGEADVMLAGGADSIAGELLMAGFCLLGALSRRNHDPEGASRPFDKDRDGFVASEGAAMLVLEEREHALARGAHIYGEVAGYGETESAYRITDLPPDGRGTVQAMQQAIADAGLVPSDIGYVNAHGTSTELNDRIESLAIRRVFGDHCRNLLVSSTKSEVGHLISAAGALEFVFCALAIRDGLIPPTRNLESTNCDSGLDYVPRVKRERQVKAALSNSIGFGGSNSSLIVARH